jgi:hypothetical protein
LVDGHSSKLPQSDCRIGRIGSLSSMGVPPVKAHENECFRPCDDAHRLGVMKKDQYPVPGTSAQ